LRLSAFQRAIPEDRRNEVGRTLVIDSIFDQTPIPFFETAQVKELGREGDLIQRNLREPFAICPQGGLREVPPPVSIAALRAIAWERKIGTAPGPDPAGRVGDGYLPDAPRIDPLIRGSQAKQRKRSNSPRSLEAALGDFAIKETDGSVMPLRDFHACTWLLFRGWRCESGFSDGARASYRVSGRQAN